LLGGKGCAHALWLAFVASAGNAEALVLSVLSVGLGVNRCAHGEPGGCQEARLLFNTM